MTTAAHGYVTPRRVARAWSILLYTAMGLAVVLAVARSGLWPPRTLHDDSARGITPQ